MSFLTPLYLLGALAVALPILAHLIRRTPPRKREFSSVMMLVPSLPKVTRRSRIEHWLLLCLRALVIGLLAVAFARPLWRTQVIAEGPTEGRWAAVLLDTSASLRRGGLWDEAQQRLKQVLIEYGPADRVGVLTFDRAPELVWSWDAWHAQDPAQRVAVVTAALQNKSPGWDETNLAQALMTASEMLDNESSREAPAAQREIVVITDFQSGSRLDPLQGYAWPEGIPVRLERIGSDMSPNNAAAQPAASADGAVRVRVTNVDGATAETFQLRWEAPAARATAPTAAAAGGNVTTAAPPSDVVVPAGQSRIVRTPPAPDGAATGTLVLAGDEQSFDNRCYVAVPRPQHATIACIATDQASDPTGQRFYVEPLFSDTPERRVQIIDWSEPEAPAADAPIRLVLLLDRPAAGQLSALRKYLQAGGVIIQVLRTPEAAADLAAFAGIDSLTGAEANVEGFSLLTDIDFGHPALAAFADPKFSDFTTLHFWKHRRLDVSGVENLRVLARFDDGDVAIGELPVGSGRIVVFTSGWSRADSQLAIWSKFVPMMNALFESTLRPTAEHQRLVVGDPLPWQRFATAAEPTWTLTAPDETTETLSDPAIEKRAVQPGFYQLRRVAGQPPVAVWAVNIPPSESDTAPLALEQLEALGVVLKQGATESQQPPETAQTRQNIANAELEQRQRLWRWALLAVLGLLVAETVLASWMSRSSTA